jgi:hypothetical protein
MNTIFTLIRGEIKLKVFGLPSFCNNCSNQLICLKTLTNWFLYWRENVLSMTRTQQMFKILLWLEASKSWCICSKLKSKGKMHMLLTYLFIYVDVKRFLFAQCCCSGTGGGWISGMDRARNNTGLPFVWFINCSIVLSIYITATINSDSTISF